MEKKNNESLLHTFSFPFLSLSNRTGPAMTTTRGGREREREERTKKKRRRRKIALSSEEEGETSSDDDEDEEEEEEEEEELENRRRKGGRGKLPSKETIRNAFEELCRCEEAGKKEGEEDGFALQNLLDLCAKYGYHDWTLAEIENMLDAYDLSEARGEKKIREKEKDSETTKTVLVTERGFLEIVRKCGVREL